HVRRRMADAGRPGSLAAIAGNRAVLGALAGCRAPVCRDVRGTNAQKDVRWQLRTLRSDRPTLAPDPDLANLANLANPANLANLEDPGKRRAIDVAAA